MAETPNLDPSTDPEDLDPSATAAGTDADDDLEPEGSEALGDAGKKALDSMKSRFKSERDKRRELEKRLSELEAPAPASDTDQPDADAIRAQAERDANAKANARIIRLEIRAAAAGKLADPADALAHLDPSSFEVDANGDIDAEEIQEAIEDLLTRKPYLAATSRPRFQGSGDGGATRKASRPSQLTRADLARMTPADIVKAKADGRLADLMSDQR